MRLVTRQNAVGADVVRFPFANRRLCTPTLEPNVYS
jgi:hypothetical protein